MRKTAFAGLFACALIFAASSSSVNAEAFDLLRTSENSPQLPLKVEPLPVEEPTPAIAAAIPAPEPQVHEVGPNENLTKISEKYQTSWVRLFNKNEQVAHPDVIKVGDKLIIPLPTEELKERPLPQPPVAATPVVTTPTVRKKAAARVSTPALATRGASSGNTYRAGYCTWYAKNKRPDLPNNLGNANTWVSRAAAQGIPTGSTPRVGAIGQQGMHVVYVESVNGDGTVTVSEMNYKGFNVVSSRTVPASTFQYIY